MARFTALLDASVLYSMVISDLLLETARAFSVLSAELDKAKGML